MNVIIVAILFFLLDYVLIDRKIWSNQINIIQNSPLMMKKSAIPFIYLLLAVGIVFFVFPRIHENNILSDSIIWGGLLGLIVYGVYDITNYTLFDKYNLSLALQDILYGCIVTAIVTYIVYHINQSFMS